MEASDHASPLLEAHGVQLVTGARVDLKVGAGETHLISGPSGCGKTRLLRAIADLDPVVGRRHLGGRALEAMSGPEWRSAVMQVPTQAHWWQHSLRAHLDSGSNDIATRLGLTPDRLDAPVGQLSAGESARGALLRALTRDPVVLLLDEPTASLDPDSRARVESLLADWVRDDRAVIWVSHDQDQVARVASHHWQLDHHGLHAA